MNELSAANIAVSSSAVGQFRELTRRAAKEDPGAAQRESKELISRIILEAKREGIRSIDAAAYRLIRNAIGPWYPFC